MKPPEDLTKAKDIFKVWSDSGSRLDFFTNGQMCYLPRKLQLFGEEETRCILFESEF